MGLSINNVPLWSLPPIWVCSRIKLRQHLRPMFFSNLTTLFSENVVFQDGRNSVSMIFMWGRLLRGNTSSHTVFVPTTVFNITVVSRLNLPLTARLNQFCSAFEENRFVFLNYFMLSASLLWSTWAALPCLFLPVAQRYNSYHFHHASQDRLRAVSMVHLCLFRQCFPL